MLFGRHIRQAIAHSLLVLFTLMLLNGIVFRHAHKLSSGKVVTHAHPYKPVGNSPYEPNNHTNNELFLLDAVSNGIFVSDFGGVVLFVASVVYFFEQPLFFVYTRHSATSPIVEKLLRGPPVLN